MYVFKCIIKHSMSIFTIDICATFRIFTESSHIFYTFEFLKNIYEHSIIIYIFIYYFTKKPTRMFRIKLARQKYLNIIFLNQELSMKTNSIKVTF